MTGSGDLGSLNVNEFKFNYNNNLHNIIEEELCVNIVDIEVKDKIVALASINFLFSNLANLSYVDLSKLDTTNIVSRWELLVNTGMYQK